MIDASTFCGRAEASPVLAGLWGRERCGEANTVAWNLLEEAGGEGPSASPLLTLPPLRRVSGEELENTSLEEML